MSNTIKSDILIIDTYYMIARAKSKWSKENNNRLLISFLNSFIKILQTFSAKKIIMPFDSYVGDSFRKKIYPQYKKINIERNINDPFYEEFKKQKSIILNIIQNTFPVYTLKYKGYETDDIIASICKIINDDINITIWSNDKDFIQLQQKIKNVKIWTPNKSAFFPSPDYDMVSFNAIIGKKNNIIGVGKFTKKQTEKILRSEMEFIKNISSDIAKFIHFKDNCKLIDLVNNELSIPQNLYEILNDNVIFDEKEFDKICESHNLYFNKYKKLFFDLEKNTNNSLKLKKYFKEIK